MLEYLRTRGYASTREIERALGLSHGAVWSALELLARAGLVEKIALGRRAYWRIPGAPGPEDALIKALCMLTENARGRAICVRRRRLKRLLPPAEGGIHLLSALSALLRRLGVEHELRRVRGEALLCLPAEARAKMCGGAETPSPQTLYSIDG